MRKVVFRKEGRCEERKGVKERKTRWLKTFLELARPLTNSACMCLSGHRGRAHPASSAAIKRPFPTHIDRGRPPNLGVVWYANFSKV